MLSLSSLLGLLSALPAAIASPVITICDQMEIEAAIYQEAFAKWEEPACYSFTYIDTGSDLLPEPVVVRTVRNGTSVQDGDGQPFQTLTDVWNLVYERCYRECPTSWDYYCYIHYATNTYIAPVYPYSLDMYDGNKTAYYIGDVRVDECPEVAPEYDYEAVYAEKNPCANWEANVAAYKEAFAKWDEPACYTFTYLDQAIWSSGEPVVRRVQKGTVLQDNGENENATYQTLTDIWNAIDEYCVHDCPASGAHYCQIEYASDKHSGVMYPSIVSIDFEKETFDEEENYWISFSPCGSTKEGLCVDYDRFKSKYYAQKQQWDYSEETGCYAYTIEGNDGIAEEARGPFQVLVYNGIPELVHAPSTNIKDENPNMTLTLSDWMARIEEKCIVACEQASNLEAYYNCTLEFDPDYWFPSHILFDKDGATTGDEIEYTVSGFMNCYNFNMFDQQRNEYAADRAHLEAVLTKNPCYDFTYTELAYSTPAEESITASVRSEVSGNAPSSTTDTFSSLFDLLTFYKRSCFPIAGWQDSFQCSIAYDDVGIPVNISVGYNSSVSDYATSYRVDNVTFVSCDAEPLRSSAATCTTLFILGAIASVVFLLFLIKNVYGK